MTVTGMSPRCHPLQVQVESDSGGDLVSKCQWLTHPQAGMGMSLNLDLEVSWKPRQFKLQAVTAVALPPSPWTIGKLLVVLLVVVRAQAGSEVTVPRT